jgi:hypothetical protein
MVGKRSDALSDEYERKARLTPALLSILPASFLVASLGAQYSVAAGIVTGPLTAIGFTYVLAQVGRDWGKKKQPYLFTLWGGKPTIVKFRHRDGTMNPLTLQRVCEAASRLINRALPTLAEELENPDAADLVYDTVGDFLKDNTRDNKKFPLIWKELVGFGFRRNLWGMKPFAVAVNAFCLAAQAYLLLRRVLVGDAPAPTLIVATILNVLLAAFWVAIVRPPWVKVTADAYAENLLAAAPVLAPLPKTTKKVQSKRTS